MVENQAPRGLLISALGAAVLAVSMFLPWYSVSITPSGAAAAQQEFAAVAQQYGNADLQTMADRIGARFGSVAGRSLATVSAHQALKNVSKIVLLLAGIALLASLLELGGVVEIGGAQIALVGFAALLCVLYRMLSPPGADTEFLSLSLSWGSWLALVSAAAIVGGALWEPFTGPSGRPEHDPLGDLGL
jgi:uncharacterized membrane protein (Fun14 family)